MRLASILNLRIRGYESVSLINATKTHTRSGVRNTVPIYLAEDQEGNIFVQTDVRPGEGLLAIISDVEDQPSRVQLTTSQGVVSTHNGQPIDSDKVRLNSFSSGQGSFSLNGKEISYAFVDRTMFAEVAAAKINKIKGRPIYLETPHLEEPPVVNPTNQPYSFGGFSSWSSFGGL